MQAILFSTNCLFSKCVLVFTYFMLFTISFLLFLLDFYSYFEYDFFQTKFSLPVASLRFNAVCLSALFVHHIWRNQNKPIFFMTFYNAKKNIGPF
jgi:hypothetical protein